MINKTNMPIDFVITWVDGNDEEWLNEKHKYEELNGIKSTANRFREWDNLRYLFRGIEKFAPWVNRVHLITCGHYPDWLNLSHPKLNLVKHSDYIPAEYLPTFNSHPIELNMHRIEGLSENFVYFNDDMFLINNVEKDDFFKDGLPCNACGFEIINNAYDFLFYNILRNNMNVICRHFNGKDFIKHNFTKLFNIHYRKELFKTILLLPWNQSNMTGFITNHLPTPYTKSLFEKLWTEEAEILSQTSSHKFRDASDVSPYLFTYWQYLTGEFTPINMKKHGEFFYISQDESLYGDVIRKQKKKLICLNDDLDCENEELFLRLKDKVKNDFNAILPDKSAFEKE